jgi:hypothetical protein
LVHIMIFHGHALRTRPGRSSAIDSGPTLHPATAPQSRFNNV